MSRAGHARLEGTTPNTKSVAPRVKNLKPITQTANWDDLPTLPSETGKDVSLEFALSKRGAK